MSLVRVLRTLLGVCGLSGFVLMGNEFEEPSGAWVNLLGAALSLGSIWLDHRLDCLLAEARKRMGRDGDGRDD